MGKFALAVTLAFLAVLDCKAHALALGRLRAGMPQVPLETDASETGPVSHGQSSRCGIDGYRPVGVPYDTPYRDYILPENITELCSSHWRIGHVVSVCSNSLSADQLVMRIKYSEISGEKIVDYMKRVFKAIRPRQEQEVVSYEILQGEYSCLNRTWSSAGHFCQCGCERVVRLHFSVEAPLSVDPDQVGWYMHSIVTEYLNSIPGVCASDTGTAADFLSDDDLDAFLLWPAASDPLPDVIFGSPASSTATFHRTMVAPGNVSPVVQSSSCKQSDWRTSFDSMGWSVCPFSMQYISGIYRSKWGRDSTSETIAMLDRAQCCEAPLGYKEESVAFRIADWSESFKREGWSLCPAGFYLHGMYRASYNSTADLRDIESAKCAKPASHPMQHGHCYDEDISQVFNSMGWATCSKGGYYVTGLYRNMHHQLKDIDRLRCCSMIEDHGSNEDLVQSLPSSAITASSCFADYTSEGMHSILGKQCTSRGHFSHCLKFIAPEDCVSEGLVIGKSSPGDATFAANGPFVVIDLGRVRSVGHGVLLGRGDQAVYQKITSFRVYTSTDLALSSWEQTGGDWDAEFSDFSHAARNQGASFVVNKKTRYIKIQATSCHRQCAMRVQLFEYSYVSNPMGTTFSTMVHSDPESVAKPPLPASMQLWSCPG